MLMAYATPGIVRLPRMSIERLLDQLRELPWEPAVAATANLAEYSSNQMSEIADEVVRLLPEPASSELAKLLATGEYAAVTSQHFLCLLKLLLAIGPNRIEGEVRYAEVSELAFRLGDHMGSGDMARDPVAGFAKLQAFWGYEDAKLLMSRYWRIFIELASSEEARADSNYVDLGGRFQELAGLPIGTFMAVAFGLLARPIGNRGRDAADWESPYFNPNVFFNKARFPAEDVQRAIGLMSVPLQAVMEWSARQVRKGRLESQFEWDFEMLRRRPLVAFNGDGSLIGYSQFLVERFTSGLFHYMAELIGDEDEEQRFRAFFGRLYEFYVREAFERIVLGQAGPVLTGDVEYNGMASSDVILLWGRDLFVGEVCSFRLGVPAKIEGDRDTIDDVVDRAAGPVDKAREKSVRPKTRQIGRCVRDIESGKLVIPGVDWTEVDRVFPILLTIEDLPLVRRPTGTVVPTLMDEIDARLALNAYLDVPKMQPLQIVSARDLEHLEAAQEVAGASPVEFLARRACDPNVRRGALGEFVYELCGALEESSFTSECRRRVWSLIFREAFGAELPPDGLLPGPRS